MRRPLVLCLLAFTALSSFVQPSSANERLLSLQITEANAAQYVQRGPDATGGIGDWILSNGTLCVIIADLNHEGDFSSRGGTLRDIGLCGRNDDQFVSSQDLLNGSLGQAVEISSIKADADGEAAYLTTRGEYQGWLVETVYTLTTNEPDRLAISKHILRQDTAAADGGIFTTAVLNINSMVPFLLSTTHPTRSSGFELEKFVGRSELAYRTAARPVDTVIVTSPHDSIQPISYGWRRISSIRSKGGKTEPLATFVLADQTAMAFATLTDTLAIGDGSKLGILQLLQTLFMGLDVGDSIHLEEEIWVVPSADTGPVTDILFADAPRLEGQINTGGPVARVHIDRADGTPFTMVTPNESGYFSAHVPVGDYRLRVLSHASDIYEQTVTIASQGTQLPIINLPSVATIALPQGKPMRLAFRGQGNTANPHFGDTLLGNIVYDENGPIAPNLVSDVHLSGSKSDVRNVQLTQGAYIVYAVRGPEFSVETAQLSVVAGENQTLTIDEPQRRVSTPEHISADMHVHSGPSMDNAFSSRQRVNTFIAEHGEVMVAAEHDTIFDFNPLLSEMGVEDKMIAITGSEVTSTVNSEVAPYTIGHINFFPLTVKPNAYRRGLTPHENRRTRDVLHEMAAAHDHPISQLNHPRSDFDLATKELPDDFLEQIEDEQFFDHMGVAAHPYNPHMPLNSEPNNSLIERDSVTGLRDIDVDVIEVMNGSQDHKPERVAASRQDWLSLVAQGIKLSASANSDSHNKWQQVALPRNMVRVKDDSLKAFDIGLFKSAIRNGEFYGTTGPFMELSLDTTRIGGTYSGSEGTLTGRIFSADWARAERLTVQVNGQDVDHLELDESGRFSVPLTFTTDSFVTIEAVGDPTEIYRAIYPGFFPYAYSNPIYVDADSNGSWTPPGLSQHTKN